LHISVVDTGIGMKSADIPRALERFGQIDSTLARKYDGAGLGLPLAKHLTELHGGTVTIESAVGAGTTVTVSLPAERLCLDRQAA
jgi:signal transduction histidine kinase